MKHRQWKKTLMSIGLLFAAAFLLGACAAAGLPQVSVATQTPALDSSEPANTQPEISSTPAPMPVKTTPPDAQEPDADVTKTPAPSQTASATPEPSAASAGTILVRGGDTLERDIIPQLCDVFGMDGDKVKETLAKAQSDLIHSGLEGFRRMEGIIVPGKYEAAGETLSEYVNIWVDSAEQRFDKLNTSCEQHNALKPYEQLTLASIVEWECIGGEFEREAAAVFLNRLDDGAKLRSCSTTEYALGYQRPYLTSDDVAVKNSYNTYQTKGLPPGPICAVDDESLAAGICPAVNNDIYYFFYDYAPDTMQFFTDYDAFKAAAAVSIQQFEEKFDIGKYDKINKREAFGG